MGKLLYFLATFADSLASLVGIRSVYEQPAYQVTRQIGPHVEIRHYAPRVAVETPIIDGRRDAAFERLFRYITGANLGAQLVKMTTPVAQTAPGRARMIAMTVPVETTSATPSMRFFLPASVVQAGAPVPTDPQVHIVTMPAMTLGVIRYAGIASTGRQAAETATLRAALDKAGYRAEGAPMYFSYDPPFTPGFLRRNEVALEVP